MSDGTNASGAYGEEPEDTVARQTGRKADDETETPKAPKARETRETRETRRGPEQPENNEATRATAGEAEGTCGPRTGADGTGGTGGGTTSGTTASGTTANGTGTTASGGGAGEAERDGGEPERGACGPDSDRCGRETDGSGGGGPESGAVAPRAGGGGPVASGGRRQPRNGDAPVGPPRIPLPRASVEDTGLPLPDPAPRRTPPSALPQEHPTPPRDEPDSSPEPSSATPHAPSASPDSPAPLVLEHRVLKALLGAWALAVCSGEEAAAVEEHLGVCGGCADEARRLREAVGLLHPPESLDLDPSLRTRVLRSCLDRRAPRVPVPGWAAPYDAETARLDALLQDIDEADWHAPVRLRWFEGEGPVTRRTTVAGVIAHLLTVDGLVATALGLADPLERLAAASDSRTPEARTEACWKASHVPPGRAIRGPWREQSHDIVRTTSFRGGGPEDADGSAGSGRLVVSYGAFELPLRDAMLDRAFECWIHAEDIAEAVDYPYTAPSGRHLHGMIDLAARMLPLVLAERRRTGLASRSPAAGRHLVPVGAPGRSLRLEIEGSGGGEWLIPLDSPGAVGSAEHEIAHVALDGAEFCRLAAGHVAPEEAAAGQVGDRDAIRDVLFAAASLSRM